MDVETYLPQYPSFDDDNFYKDIFLKEEFYSLRSATGKNLSAESRFFPHQRIIQRFISSHTLYNELLLFHGLGSGKTCSAVAVAEAVKYLIQKEGKEGELYMQPVLAIVKNRILRTNIVDQLVRVCTVDEYVKKLEDLEETDIDDLPENEDELFDEMPDDLPEETGKKGRRKVQVEFGPEEEVEKTREKELVSHKYKFRMMGQFANEIDALIEAGNEQEVIDKYSNRIIIIDEVHNLRRQSEGDEESKDSKYYGIYMKFLHLVKNCKILILTGTPMVDSPKDMVSIMNLILPENNQLELDDLEDQEIFKSKVKGRISYVRESGEVPTRIDEGIIKKPLQTFKIVYSEMSDFQYKAYKKTIKAQGKKKFSNDARHAANFVFPDGTSGVNAEKKFLNVKGTRGILQSERKNFAQNLQKFSCKFAKITETLKNPKYEKELVFIFSDYVAGGGTTLLYYALLSQGLSAFTGSSGKGKNRIAMITHSTNVEERNRIIEQYRSPENKYGDYLRILIGSRAISEGVDLKNVRQVHILAPHWNNSVTEQAIGRGIRMGSHKDLTLSERYVRVFRHASTKPNELKKDDETIDIYLYKLSETKDIKIGNTVRMSQESAIDCGLNFERNKVTDKSLENTRSCQYQACDYECDGIEDYAIRNKHGIIRYEASPDIRDYSTWLQFYSNYDVQQMIEKIVSLFHIKAEYSLAEIADNYPEYQIPIILEALRRIIDLRMPINNILGIPSYLIEANNIYFLQQTWSANIDISPLLSFYGLHTFISYPSSFEMMVMEFQGENQLNEICPIKKKGDQFTEKQIMLFIEKLNYSNKLAILELILGMHYSDKDTNDVNIQLISSVVQGYFKEYINDDEKSHIFYSLDFDPENTDNVRKRCYNPKNNTWLFCDTTDAKTEVKRKKLTREGRVRREIKQTIHLAPEAKVIGTIDSFGDFRIVDRFTYESTKGKQSAKGKVCKGTAGGGWNIPPLAKLIGRLPINLEKPPYDLSFPDDVDRDDPEALRTYILENTKIKFDKEPSVIDDDIEVDDEVMKELRTYAIIIYNMAERGGTGLKKADLCGIVKNYLNENDLLFEI